MGHFKANWAFKVKQRAHRPPPPSNDTTQRARRISVGIPYVRGVSERLQKTFKTYGINTYMKPYNTLRSQLVRVKDKTPKEKQSNLVYKFTCGNAECNVSYIGETKQALKSRISQHQRPSSGDTYDSAIFLHSQDTGHKVDIRSFQIVDKEEDWYRRGVKEAIWERIHQPALNKKGGLRVNLPHLWDRNIISQFSQFSTPNTQHWPCHSPDEVHRLWMKRCDVKVSPVKHL